MNSFAVSMLANAKLLRRVESSVLEMLRKKVKAKEFDQSLKDPATLLKKALSTLSSSALTR
jgi:hypothetical protein